MDECESTNWLRQILGKKELETDTWEHFEFGEWMKLKTWMEAGKVRSEQGRRKEGDKTLEEDMVKHIKYYKRAEISYVMKRGHCKQQLEVRMLGH